MCSKANGKLVTIELKFLTIQVKNREKREKDLEIVTLKPGLIW